MSDSSTTPPTPSLDMHSEKDRGLLRNAMRRWPKRWRGLNEEFKDELAQSLKDANTAARRLAASDNAEIALEGVKMIPGIVRTAVMMEGQNQADEHLLAKEERLDAGMVTENVGVRVLKPDRMK